ncbi:MAG: sigma-70 family RNA polymerase sigma factor [Rubrivivax sp.]|nr:MAG: sigma-70 family RNA polymerase sigma factor [Rubrivivax sp.]
MRSDEHLLLDLETGRAESAARQLYRGYQRELFGFACHRLGDRALAEEVVQDVFTRVWRNAASYDASRASVRTWIYGILRNAIVDAERRRSRRPPAARYGQDDALVGIDEPIERTLLRWQVADAMARLTAEHREVLHLGHLGGLTVAEIAETLGIPPGTVKSRTFFAMKNLRLALEELEVTP